MTEQVYIDEFHVLPISSIDSSRPILQLVLHLSHSGEYLFDKASHIHPAIRILGKKKIGDHE